jgi:molecular chaperone DnaJ
MSNDYYTALGVSKGADLKKIKKAYREVVKKYHPDVAHSREGVERFLEVREAYETLGDPDKRERYDLEQRQTDARVTVMRATEIVRTRRSYLDDMEGQFSFVDEFFEGFVPGFFDLERGRIRGKDLYFEAILSPEEARRGGVFPVTVPVSEPCPRCMKTGRVNDLFCPVCSGMGRVRSDRAFSLAVPANVSHGTEMQISMEDIGLQDTSLYIRVLIDPSM